jgi:Nucleotidyltransferase of unknown function (DUF6036)
MSTEDPILSREVLHRAFHRLDALLVQRSLTADVFVFGGAAVVLGFESRPATRDVDALWQPHGAVLDAAWKVAEELQLPRWWLNDQASAYLPSGNDPTVGASAFTGEALRVTTASPELLLAMKVRAARPGDHADIRLLAAHLELRAAPDIIAIAERVFKEEVPSRQRQIIEDLFNDSSDG